MNGKMICAGWRSTRKNARRPSAWTCSNSPGWPRPSSPALLAVAACVATALELAAGLGQEDVVQRRRVQVQRGQLQVGLVERADHVATRGVAVGERQGDVAAAVAAAVAERLERLVRLVDLGRVDWDDLDAGAADLGLELGGRSLGHDLAAIDDPDSVGQDV